MAWRVISAYLALALVASVIVGLLGTESLESRERGIQDFIFRHFGREPSDDIVIVKVDKESIEELDEDKDWPLPRGRYAKLIERLSEYGVKAMGFDIFFRTPGSTEGERLEDEELVAESKSAGVYHSFGISNLVDGELSDNAEALIKGLVIEGTGNLEGRNVRISAPLDGLVKNASGLGHTSVLPDLSDGMLRRIPLLVKSDGVALPSLALQLACSYYDTTEIKILNDKLSLVIDSEGGIVEIPIDKQGNMLINYAGELEEFKQYSMSDILSNNLTESDQESLKGKIVLIGATDGRDEGPTPLKESTPGVVIHANALDTIIQQNFLRFAGRIVEIANLGILLFLGLLVDGVILVGGVMSINLGIRLSEKRSGTKERKMWYLGVRGLVGFTSFIVILTIYLVYLAIAIILFRSVGVFTTLAAPIILIVIVFILTSILRFIVPVSYIYRKALPGFAAQYAIWSEYILTTLQEQNRVDPRRFPRAYRADILAKFVGENPRLNLNYDPEAKILQIAEKARLAEFSAQWSKAQKSLEEKDAQGFQSAIEEITRLFCHAVGFKALDMTDSLARLHGQMMDTSNPAFRLTLPPHFPLVCPCKEDFSDEDIINTSGLLYNLGLKSEQFALLVVFGNAKHLRDLLNNSTYRYDFIVLDRGQLWEILANTDPIRRLTELILDQVDLNRVSPFQIGGPVSGKMFFGRAREERTLLQSISRSAFVVVANRKVGKTSLLNRFYAKLNRDPRYQSFLFDLQPVSDYEYFYYTLRQGSEQFANEIEEMGASPSPLDFYGLIRRIKEQSDSRQLVFIFDEVDELLAYDVDQKEVLFKTFRSLYQREDVRFVFAGTTTLVKRLQDPNSPFFNFCETIRLGLLEKDDAEKLITAPMGEMGISFENRETIVNRILEMSACHPNILQYFGKRLIERINIKNGTLSITEGDLEAVVGSYEFYEYFENLIWGQASPLEKLIVYLMWNRTFSEAEVLAELSKRNLPVEDLKESLETLRIYNVLTQESDRYHFTFREFGKLMEANSDIAELLDEEMEEVRDGNF